MLVFYSYSFANFSCCVVVIYGILIGLLLSFITADVAVRLITFNPKIFFLFLLPAIIFESGFSIKKVSYEKKEKTEHNRAMYVKVYLFYRNLFLQILEVFWLFLFLVHWYLLDYLELCCIAWVNWEQAWIYHCVTLW